MKKNYLAPKMSISRFAAENVITSSGGAETTAVESVRTALQEKQSTILGDTATVFASMEF